MAKAFYDRLHNYFARIGSVLRGEADAASIFSNTTDLGMSRERIYADFLRTHLPSSCNVQFGGFLFGLEGEESNQIDLIVTADVCPQFNFSNRDGRGKTFSCVDGTLAVGSLKSNLDSTQLREALTNLASIPSKAPLLQGQGLTLLNIPDYPAWPFKIIYAPKGVSLVTLGETLLTYAVINIQSIVVAANHVLFDYHALMRNITSLLDAR